MRTQHMEGNNMRLGVTLSGIFLGLSLVGCTGGGKPAAKTAGSDSEETGMMAGADGEHQTISKAGAAELIPKEKRGNISADARADFDKAMSRYAAAKKSGGVSGGECSSVSDAFKRVA